MYIHQGSTRIGDVYNPFYGGWITIFVIDLSNYFMQVKDRMGNQINNPKPTRRYGVREEGLPTTIFDVDSHNFCFDDFLHFEISFKKKLIVDDNFCISGILSSSDFLYE